MTETTETKENIENIETKEKRTYDELLKDNNELINFFHGFTLMALPFRIGSNEPIKIECLVPLADAKNIYEQFQKLKSEQQIAEENKENQKPCSD